MTQSSAVNWIIGWTLLGLAGVGVMLYSALNHRWLSFALAVLVVWQSCCLQSVCAEKMKSA